MFIRTILFEIKSSITSTFNLSSVEVIELLFYNKNLIMFKKVT